MARCHCRVVVNQRATDACNLFLRNNRHIDLCRASFWVFHEICHLLLLSCFVTIIVIFSFNCLIIFKLYLSLQNVFRSGLFLKDFKELLSCETNFHVLRAIRAVRAPPGRSISRHLFRLVSTKNALESRWRNSRFLDGLFLDRNLESFWL